VTVGSSSVAAPELAARRVGSSEPSAVSETSYESWGEKVYAALPLFIVGGACLAVTVDFYLSRATTPFVGNSSVRLAPWALFLALAVTGLSAGVFALLVEDEEPIPAEPVAATPRSSPAAPWDESTVIPSQSSHLPPRTWEQHSIEAEDLAGWSPAEPQVTGRVSPDVVLVQIDEIAASLRKKPPPSQSS